MIPIEASEIEEFTPPSLANVPAPPVFLLRAASGREWRKFQYLLQAEGLEFHDREAFRSETLKALRLLYDPETFGQAEGRLRSHWALLDQNGSPEPDEMAAVAELTERLTREWRPLTAMGADNIRFAEESGRIAVAMFTVGWRDLPVPYAREGGQVPLGKVDDLEDALSRLEREAAADAIEGVGSPGLAFTQLCNAAYARLHLTKEEEKNSSSPPPAQPGPNGSTKTRSGRTDRASSKASASSKKALSAASL